MMRIIILSQNMITMLDKGDYRRGGVLMKRSLKGRRRGRELLRKFKMGNKGSLGFRIKSGRGFNEMG